jgi:Winged helix DNA-binding domain
MPDEVLDARALNRALLARQGLLARSSASVLEMIEQLVGMQAQEPDNPYLALWSRLDGFRPEQLSELIAGRRAVRAALMRSTIHLASARDCLAIHPITQPLLARVFVSPWGKKLGGVDVAEVAAAGRELIAAAPRTRAELSAALAPRWPQADPLALAYAVTYHLALVQVPPRGLWGASGQARWGLAESWLGDSLDARAAPEPLVLRYLAAFGPATVADIRTWSGITGLRAVVEGLRPQLRTFRDERGRELFDVPDAPLPDRSTPAPPRFLPEYDNLTLSHADRSRILAGQGPGLPFPRGGRAIGTLLAGGFYRANWKVAEGDGVATLTIDRFSSLPDDPADTIEEVEAEGAGLLALVSPEAEHRIEFVPPP